MSMDDREASGNRDWEQEINEIAQRELNEPPDPEVRQQFVQEIRNWIVSKEEFNGQTDTDFILRFLRVSKYNVKKVKKRIKRYYQLKHRERKWFEWTEESENDIIKVIKSGSVYYTNFPADCTENMFVAKIASIDPKKYSADYIAACVAKFSDIMLNDPRFQVHGAQVVGCVKGITLDFITQCTPLLIWRFVHCWQNVMPIRIKGIHLINTPPIMHDIILCIRALLSKKLKSRFFVHKANSKTFVDMMRANYLPDELGGSSGSIEPLTEYFLDKFRNGKEQYLHNCRYTWNKGIVSEID